MSQKKQQTSKYFISTYDTPNYPTGFELVLYTDADKIADNTLDEIFITDLLDNFADEILPQTLDSLLFKLKVGGIIHIQSLDFEQFNWYVSSRALDISNKNMLYDNRTNIQTMSTIERLLLSSQFKLQIQIKKYINGIEYYLRAEKVAADE